MYKHPHDNNSPLAVHFRKYFIILRLSFQPACFMYIGHFIILKYIEHR